MPTRAQRRRNQEARVALEQLEASKRTFPDRAAEKLLLRRDFVAEAIRSSSLVSITFKSEGDIGCVDVYCGEITYDNKSKLHGDSLVNWWTLPSIDGYRINYDDTSALVNRIDPGFNAFDISNLWLKTADDLLSTSTDMALVDAQEHLTITRDGLTVLAHSIGHDAVRMGLRYIDEQLHDRYPTATF